MKIFENLRFIMGFIIFVTFIGLFKVFLNSNIEHVVWREFIVIGLLLIVGIYTLRNRFNFYYSKANTIKVARIIKFKNINECLSFFALNLFFFIVIIFFVGDSSEIKANLELIKQSSLFIIGFIIILIVGGVDIFLYYRIERVNKNFEVNNDTQKAVLISQINQIMIFRNEIQFIEESKNETSIIFSLKDIQITEKNYYDIIDYFTLNGISKHNIKTEIK